jgi:hypothetical protein
MEAVMETIRNAIAPDATPEAKAAGVTACRAIITALDAAGGEPMPAPTAAPPATQLAAIVGALRGMPPDQLLDLAITRLRAALPPGTEAQPVKTYKVPIIPLGPLGARK